MNAPSTTDLHAAILNLPCKPANPLGTNPEIAYKFGHRDARHAAAELVSAALSQPTDERAVLQQALDALRAERYGTADPDKRERAIEAIERKMQARAALAGHQQEAPAQQEPVAWQYRVRDVYWEGAAAEWGPWWDCTQAQA